MAETQPQLHPALLRSSPMSSQYFTRLFTNRPKCYEPRKTYTWQQQRTRAHAKCRKVKSRHRRAPVSTPTSRSIRHVCFFGLIDRATEGYRIPESRYGLGLEFSKIGDLDVLGHVGNLPGFTTYVRMIPSRKVGVVALANANQAHLDEATDEALCYLLNNRRPCTAPITTAAGGPALENFVGQYENSSRISIVVRNGQLFWFADPQDKYASPAARAGIPLRRVGSYRFARPYPGDVFFVIESAGKPRYVLLHDVAYKKIE